MKPEHTEIFPRIPIPEPLRGTETGTWTHHSIVSRLPQIAQRVISENKFLPKTVSRLEKMIQEIPDGLIRHTDTPEAADNLEWIDSVAPYLANNWLEIPWFFAELYFYRRILEATGFFQRGPGHNLDPYLYQKQQGLDVAQDAICNLCQQSNSWVGKKDSVFEILQKLLSVALWGNQADLSLWPADTADQSSSIKLTQNADNTIVDHSSRIIDCLSKSENEPGHIDFVADNAGFELVCDLVLIDFFLHSGLAKKVHLHVKAYPIFVSDATPEDIHRTISQFEAHTDLDIHQFGVRLRNQLTKGLLVLRSDPFWTSPLSFWEIPADLRQDLSTSKMAIFKGDANYRRLLGDRHWKATDRFSDIVGHITIPIVALRVSKSDVVAGLAPGQAENIRRLDPDWMINGRWGLIQSSL